MITSFVFLFLSGFINLHPLHISMTNVSINESEQKVEVTYQFHTDDFTLLFFHLFEKMITPVKETEFTAAELNMIDSYMERRFFLTSDKDTLQLHYVKKDQNDDTLWLYYSGSLGKGRINSLTVTNQLLLDLYEDQTNLVIFSNGKIEQGLTFNTKIQRSEIDLKFK
jgi:hypothetical protein